MELIGAVIVACCLALVYVYVRQIQRPRRNLPPGPMGLPLVGYLPFLGHNPVEKLSNLKQKYGNVVSLRLGSNLVVILQDWLAMKEALIKQADVFIGRPHLLWFKTAFTDNDIIFGDYGHVWKEQRRFSLQILRDFGFANSHIEAVIVEQVEKLSDELSLKARDGKPVNVDELFSLTILNIIWEITAGRSFEKTDEYMLKILKVARSVTSGTMHGAINHMPVLRHLIPQRKKHFEEFASTCKTLQHFVEQEMETHVRNFQENNLRDFIDVYLSEIYKRRGDDGQDSPPFDRDRLVSNILDLFVAGVDTLDTTMHVALLSMALHPEIQRKVQEELDGVVAKDSFLSYSQRTLAPYTEATLLEIQRNPTIVPLAVSHKTMNDATLLGFRIPKGTTVLPNLYAVHHDKSVWGDPDVFRPERFLDESGKVKKPEWFMPFSVGPRMCLGESLARTEMHLLFTTLLRRFTFETVPGEPAQSMKPIPGGVIKLPPFSLIVKLR